MKRWLLGFVVVAMLGAAAAQTVDRQVVGDLYGLVALLHGLNSIYQDDVYEVQDQTMSLIEFRADMKKLEPQVHAAQSRIKNDAAKILAVEMATVNAMQVPNRQEKDAFRMAKYAKRVMGWVGVRIAMGATASSIDKIPGAATSFTDERSNIIDLWFTIIDMSYDDGFIYH